MRHGLPVRIDAADGAGPADPGLSERGHEQARRVVQALAGAEVTALYSSHLARARETALPLAEALGIDVVELPGIAEFDSHEPSYVPVEQLRASGDPRWGMLQRGELYSVGVDPAAFRARVVETVESVVAAHPGGRAVLFTHAGVLNAYAGHVLAQQKSIWFGPAYCSVSRLVAARDGRRSVLSLNETGHVRDLLAG